MYAALNVEAEPDSPLQEPLKRAGMPRPWMYLAQSLLSQLDQTIALTHVMQADHSATTVVTLL